MAETKFSRRNLLKIGSAAVATTALAACGGGQGSTPAQPQPTAAGGAAGAAATQPAAQAPAGDGAAIQWWVGWGNLTAAIDKIKETTEVKQMIGNNTLDFKPSVKAEALLTAIAGGTAPDGASNYDYPNLWSRGALAPVDDMINASTVIKKDQIQPKAICGGG